MTSSGESSIDIDYYCTYLTETNGIEWTNENYQAMNMVKAIKGSDYKGYISIMINGVEKRIYSENASEFSKRSHQPLAKIISNKYGDGVTIVPIPSSKTTKQNCDKFITRYMAERAAKVIGGGCKCAPILVFKEEMPSSRSGGNRSPYFIESQLIITGETKLPIILLDDVMTLGGHLKAACWKLQSDGMKVIGAVTFARTVKDNSLAAFGPHTEKLDVSKTPTLWDF
jgi:predicted amidophosphoribosyltransferase